MLKKVAKTESRLKKFDKEKLKSHLGFRDELKSTGKSKYALEEVDEVGIMEMAIYYLFQTMDFKHFQQ